MGYTVSADLKWTSALLLFLGTYCATTSKQEEKNVKENPHMKQRLPRYSALDVAEKEMLFQGFLHKYNKTYRSNEKEKRFKIFCSNLRKCDEINEKHGTSKEDLFEFADMSDEELGKVDPTSPAALAATRTLTQNVFGSTNQPENVQHRQDNKLPSHASYNKAKEVAHYGSFNIVMMRMLFEGFLLKYNKTYSSIDEKEKRFEIFRANLRECDKWNDFGDDCFGITKFSDLTSGEFKMGCGFLAPKATSASAMVTHFSASTRIPIDEKKQLDEPLTSGRMRNGTEARGEQVQHKASKTKERPRYSALDDEEMRIMYDGFLYKHKQKYNSTEKEKRFQLFRQDLIICEKINNEPSAICNISQIMSWPGTKFEPDPKEGAGFASTTRNFSGSSTHQPRKGHQREESAFPSTHMNTHTTPSTSEAREIVKYGAFGSEEMRMLFDGFIIKYNKTYNSSDEKEKRFGIFRGNLLKCDEENKQGGQVLGITKFSDLSADEFKKSIGLINPKALAEFADKLKWFESEHGPGKDDNKQNKELPSDVINDSQKDKRIKAQQTTSNGTGSS